MKWLASTCLAACVGVGLIGVTVYASTSVNDGGGIVNSIARASLAAMEPVEAAQAVKERQMAAGHKSDRIQVTELGLTTKHIIHDTTEQRRGGRAYIGVRPFARVVARLSTAQPDDTDDIPTFNPFKLFSNPTPLGESGGSDGDGGVSDVTVDVADLEGSLPEEDGLELQTAQVAQLVAEAREMLFDGPYAIRPAIQPAGGSVPLIMAAYRPETPVGPDPFGAPRNVTVIEKADIDFPEQVLEGGEVNSLTVRRGDNLLGILESAGAERWQARRIAEAMAPVFSPSALMPGQELRYMLLPAPREKGGMEPVRISIFSDDTHEVTIVRDGSGEYVASDDPVQIGSTVELRRGQPPKRANLYTSFYHAALGQGVAHETVEQLLRVHSHDVDFKRPVRPGDSFEVFYELRNGGDDSEHEAGEVLFTAMILDGERREFYRFRTPDGDVDFYDAEGNSARTFLMRRPVRGARLSSGFGARNHPLLRQRRMHLGTDWAAPRGTPIMAAGSGVVETVERKGGYGNYVRIRHGNGYKTAYAHLHSFAEGLRPGVKVEQGQVIGQVGSTGMSTGPHLHFEVLVNNRHVDPMTIQVPRGRQLAGRELAEFIKERNKIDELMQRSPVTTRVASIGQEAR